MYSTAGTVLQYVYCAVWIKLVFAAFCSKCWGARVEVRDSMHVPYVVYHYSTCTVDNVRVGQTRL